MSNIYRANRKASDEDIVRLNSLGLSLSTIGKKLGINGTTVTQRLRALNVKPADTRRAFMEDIFDTMPPSAQAWLTGQLGPHMPVKTYVQNLLMKEYLAAHYTGTPKP